MDVDEPAASRRATRSHGTASAQGMLELASAHDIHKHSSTPVAVCTLVSCSTAG